MASREMWLFRWTGQGIEDRVAKGMVQHRADWEQLLAASGGTLVDFNLFSGSGDWDGMYIIDWEGESDITQFTHGHFQARVGNVIEAAQVVRLVTPEQFDAHEPVAAPARDPRSL